MSYLVLAALLAPGFDPQSPPPTRPGVGAGQQAQTASHLDGTWTVICAEKDGQKLADVQNHTVTIQGDVLTWNKDGKEHRVHLQLGANHRLTATPAEGQQATGAQTRSGEQQNQSAGTAAKQGEQGQTAAAREQNSQRPGTALPGRAQGQAPAATPTRTAGTPGSHEEGTQAGPHEGFYIATSDFLCIAFDQGFGGDMHGQHAATSPAAKEQPTQAATRPGQPATTTQPGATANANRGINPQAAPGTQQVRNETPGQPGGVRTANYSPGAANMQHEGFVLILHRQGGPAGQQHTPRPTGQQQGFGAK